MSDCTRSFTHRWMVAQTFLHELLRLICWFLHGSCDIYMDIFRHILCTHMDITFYPYEHYCFFAWTMLDIHKLILVSLPCRLYCVDQCTLGRLDLGTDVYIFNMLYITLTFVFLQIQTTFFCTKKYYERITILFSKRAGSTCSLHWHLSIFNQSKSNFSQWYWWIKNTQNSRARFFLDMCCLPDVKTP